MDVWGLTWEGRCERGERCSSSRMGQVVRYLCDAMFSK
jgi:hypothetical protein